MSKIDQKEYLKRYLTSDDKLLKKKKKKSKDKKEKTVKTTVKIIDDNESAYTNHEEIDEGELYATNEEAPQIVGVVDERAPQVILRQEYQQSGKWKGLDSAKTDGGKRNAEKNARKRYSSDESPPRAVSSKRERSRSKEAPKRRYSSDQSPPRREVRRERSPSKNAPKRRSSDQSPPRRDVKRERSHSRDRSKRRYSPDQSPPRREVKRERSPQRDRKSRWSPDQSPPTNSGRMTKTLDGKASGLQNAKNLRVENERHRERQKKIFDSMGADVSGRNADVVIRDRRGRNKEFEFDLEKEKKKMEAEEARKRVYDKWGKGLKQVEAAEQRRREFEHEASKPLARSANDEDLQDHLKNQERLDDPMLLYMRKKKVEEKRSQGVLERPIYQGDFPDNRFNVRPGHRWDGVDRSNGYEKKYFTMINSKKSLEEEAYRYSTEDM